MKQTLQLKLGQHLTMTPQLQQAIRLLQLSTLELQTEIQEALDSNPMLEITEEGGTETNSENQDGGTNGQSGSAGDSDNRSAETLDTADRAVDKQEQEIPNDLPTDSDWEDTYESYESYGAATRNNDSEIGRAHV